MHEELISRLRDFEDGFTERKMEGAANSSELRKTLVAFANSVPEGKTSILFIGVSDEGTPIGLINPDSLQKTIRKVAEKDCYPPVNYQAIVFQADGKTLLAVEVKPSNERPHFSGPAFIRIGSESVAASKPIYDELIASRNTKVGRILRSKNDVITFQSYELDMRGNKRPVSTMECRIEKCDAHVLDLYDISSCRHFSIPVEELKLNFDQAKQRLMLEALSE